MNIQQSIIKSKILKQNEKTTKVNILETHIFNYGTSIKINDYIISNFIKIDNTIPTLSINVGNNISGSLYYIDSSNGFILKDINNNIVNDGLYKLKTNSTYYNIGVGWNSDDYFLYNIKDGIPIEIKNNGLYFDKEHNIVINIENNNIIDTPDGYYIYNDLSSILQSNSNIGKIINDGTYYILLPNNKNKIYEINNGIAKEFNDYFINLDNDIIYNNQKIYLTCIKGNIIFTNDKLLVKTDSWKFINLNNF